MADDDTPNAELRERYDVFWQLDFQVSGLSHDDLTVEMMVGLIEVFRIAGQRIAITEPDKLRIDVPDDLSALNDQSELPDWEAIWARFKQQIRDERIRLGQALGIEPPGEGPNKP